MSGSVVALSPCRNFAVSRKYGSLVLTAPHLDGSREVTNSTGIPEDIVKLNYHLYQLLTYDDTGKSSTLKSVEVFHVIMPSAAGKERVAKHWLLPKGLTCFRTPERIKLRPGQVDDGKPAVRRGRGCEPGDVGVNWARAIPTVTLDPLGGCRLKHSLRERLDRADSSGSASRESLRQACSVATSAAAPGTTDACTAQTKQCVAVEQKTPTSTRLTTEHGHHVDHVPNQELNQRRQLIRGSPDQQLDTASEITTSHDERSPKRQRVMDDSSIQSMSESDNRHPDQAPAAMKHKGFETISETLHRRADLTRLHATQVPRPVSQMPRQSMYVRISTSRRLDTFSLDSTWRCMLWRKLADLVFDSEPGRSPACLNACLIAYSRTGVS